MKTSSCILTMAAILVAMAAGLAFSAPPKTMHFQGYLTDAADSAVNGTLDMRFSLYDSATNSTALWTEAHDDVPVDQGVYSVILGGGNSTLGDLPFDQTYYIGVTVGSDAEMSPRIELASSAYAIGLRPILFKGHSSSSIYGAGSGNGAISYIVNVTEINTAQNFISIESNNKIRFLVDGLYRVSFYSLYSLQAPNYILYQYRINSSQIINMYYLNNSNSQYPTTMSGIGGANQIFSFSNGDTVEIIGTGATTDVIFSGTPSSFLQIEYLGAE